MSKKVGFKSNNTNKHCRCQPNKFLRIGRQSVNIFPIYANNSYQAKPYVIFQKSYFY